MQKQNLLKMKTIKISFLNTSDVKNTIIFHLIKILCKKKIIISNVDDCDLLFIGPYRYDSVKSKICLLGNPFTEILPRTFFLNDSIALGRIQNGCLTIFENLIYTGIDEDHRKLGAFHALSALTVVSRDARQSMPWLYESLVY